MVNRIAKSSAFALCLPLLVAGCSKKFVESVPKVQIPDRVLKATIQTTAGAISIELLPDRAPATVENFLAYVSRKHYDGTIFHRIIPGFIIQGGGVNENLTEKPTLGPIPNEATPQMANRRGTLAMARLPDPNSARAQFFINLKDNPNLDVGGYDARGFTVFGRVVDGMEIVDSIGVEPTESRNGFENVPIRTVTIQSVKLME